jgi:hypothetical protein
MLLVFSHQGLHVLHASAVEVSGRGVAFIGQSGWGKSTLATSFGQAGFPLLTDDALLLEAGAPGESFHLVPSFPGIRLWDDSLHHLFAGEQPEIRQDVHYTRKSRLIFAKEALVTFSDRPIPLQRIYFLSPPVPPQQGDAIALVPLTPREAMTALLEYVFRLDITDCARLQEEFYWLCQLASKVSCYRLSYPRDFAQLPAVRSAILADLDRNSILIPELI